MPSQTLTHSAVTPVESEQVWRALDRPETWEKIIGIERVVDPRNDDEGRLQGFGFETTIAGLPYRANARCAERVEGERLTWSIQSPDVTGSIAVALSEAGDGGTKVDISLTLAMEGFLAAMFFPMVVQALAHEFPMAVKDFAASLSD